MWLLSTVVCCLMAAFSTVFVLRNSDEEAKQKIKAEQANLVALGLIDLISLNAFREIVPRLPGTLQGERLSEIIRIYNLSGKLLYTNLKVPDIDNADSSRFQDVDRDFYVIEGEHVEYLARLRSYETLDGDDVWIEIATPRQKVGVVLARIAGPIFLTFITLLAVS